MNNEYTLVRIKKELAAKLKVQAKQDDRTLTSYVNQQLRKLVEQK